MARKSRLHVPGGLYHIVLRGWNNDPLFRKPQDWKTFEQFTARALTVCRARVHAYCWLPTEAHFALEVGYVRSGSVMQRICGPYARYVRHKHGVAKVFQSRYEAQFVDRDMHLLALVRNITRAPLSTTENFKLDAYPWSSHVAYLGLRDCPWLRTDEVLEALAWRGADTDRAYRRLIEASQNADEIAMLKQASRLGRRTHGNITYLEVISTHPHRRETSLLQVLDAVSNRVNIPVDVMCSSSRQRQPSMARALAAWHAFRGGIASLAEIARQFDRNPSSIGDAVEFYRCREPELFNESLEQLLGQARSMPLAEVGTMPSMRAPRRSLSDSQRPVGARRARQ